MILAPLFIFLAVFLGIVGVFFAFGASWDSSATSVRRRLRRMEQASDHASEGAHEELLRAATPAEQALFSLPLMTGVEKLVQHAGLSMRPMRFLLLGAAGCLLLMLLTLVLTGKLLLSLAAGVCCAFILYCFLVVRKKQREQRFTEQLPDALAIMARSLRAGHSLSGAVELVSQELPEPSASLFGMAYEQQKLGMRMSDSLVTLLDRIDSMDLHFFVTIVRINSETGGNLAEILDKLAETVRNRLQIRRQVEVLTAEGRLSGYVLVILPVVVFFAFQALRPEYVSVFYTEKICQLWLLGAALAQVVGFLVIRKIVNIRI